MNAYLIIAATVSISGPSTPVSESAVSFNVKIEVTSGKIERDVTLLLSTMDVTATGLYVQYIKLIIWHI